MIPLDIESSSFKIATGKRDSIIIITGGLDLHHLHFGLAIQTRFPGMVRNWYARDRSSSMLNKPALRSRITALKQKAKQAIDEHGIIKSSKMYAKPFLRKTWARTGQSLIEKYGLSQHERCFDYMQSEQRIFSSSVARLNKGALLKPKLISSPNSEDFRQQLKQDAPYFMLSLGGPIIGKKTLNLVRGLCINTHSGWSPEMRGSMTTEQALYYRQINWLGNTVHITTPSTDAGPIIARSNTALYADDTPADCFYRAIAAGNCMLINSVDAIIKNKGDTITVYHQPKRGTTFRASELSRDRKRSIQIDWQRKWLRTQLNRQINF